MIIVTQSNCHNLIESSVIASKSLSHNFLQTPSELWSLLRLLKDDDRKKPPPPGGFPIYYVPSSTTVCSKGTPLEEPGTNPSRGVLLHTVLDEGT